MMQNPQIQTASRDLCEFTRDADVNHLWQGNADLMRAYAVAGDPQTPESEASTRELCDLLIDGLYKVYGCDITAEDIDGRQWGCPLRALIFAAFKVREMLCEAAGTMWWQIDARNAAAAARTQRDACAASS